MWVKSCNSGTRSDWWQNTATGKTQQQDFGHRGGMKSDGKAPSLVRRSRCSPSEGALSAVALNFGLPHLVMCEKQHSVVWKSQLPLPVMLNHTKIRLLTTKKKMWRPNRIEEMPQTQTSVCFFGALPSLQKTRITAFNLGVV